MKIVVLSYFFLSVGCCFQQKSGIAVVYLFPVKFKPKTADFLGQSRLQKQVDLSPSNISIHFVSGLYHVMREISTWSR